MPIKSAKQFRLMQAAAHGKKYGIGPSEEVAKEFIKKTSGKDKKKFSKDK